MSGPSISVLREQVQALVAGLDPDVMAACDAERELGEWTLLKNAAAAGEALIAARAADAGAWRGSGARSEADWLARQTGDTVGNARAALETAKNVRGLEKTSKALRKGELSPAQANAIAGAASASPGAEDKLLGVAKHQPLKSLRDECDWVKAAADPDPTARHDRIHRSRFWRRWTDKDGARCGQYRMTPENAALLEKAAGPFVEAAFRRARDEGRREPSEAYAADGLVDMARAILNGGTTASCAPARAGTTAEDVAHAAETKLPKPGWPRGETITLVNLESLHRGSVEDGELCEIPGVGPIPVSVARELFGESILKIVIRDGVDIRTVVHLGRQPTAAQRTAIFVRDGGICVRPTCSLTFDHIDHTADWADTHQTTLDQLGGLCRFDHDLKTHHGHWCQHGPRGWEWHQPDGTTEYERPPPDDG